VGRCGVDASDSGQEPVVGSSDHSDEPLGSVKGREFLDSFNDYHHLKKDSAPWK